MSTISVVDGTQKATLHPGFYWIEMSFDRPTSDEVFLRALRTIGFDSAMLEYVDTAPGRIGAVSAVNTSSLYSLSRTSTTAGPSATQAASVYRAPAAAAPAAAPAVRPTTTVGPSGTQAAARYVAPTPPDRFRHPTEGGSYGGGGGGGDAAPAPGDATQEPPLGPSDAGAPYEGGPGPGGPGGGGGGGDGGDYGPPEPSEWDSGAPGGGPAAPRQLTSYSLPPGALPPVSGPKPPVPGAVIINPGGLTAWWLCPPGTKWSDVSVGRRGVVVGGTSGSTYRFIGQLGSAIDIKSLPGLEWTIAHSIQFDPWGPMNFRLTPHALAQGQLYDLRFLSRDKTAKTKADVLALLTGMGFKPATIFLSKRNMRIPGRPLTTLSEWFGVGVWSGPDSVIVSSDPFYFAEVRPTT